MKKIQYNGSSKILKGLAGKVNAIIDKLIVDVKVNGTSVVVVNEDGEREADIDFSLADQNVKQSPTTDNKDYRVLLSKSDNDTEETDIARKNTDFKYNPSTGNLQATKLNGNTIPTDTDTLALNKDIPTQASDIGAIPATEKGANSGVATLDSSGKVPTTQLPSYVDDVVEGYYYNDNFYEDSAHTELITPETSKIYVDLSTDTCYRWGGSAYVEISGGAVQSDWNQNDSSQLDYIKNKPTIPTIPTVATGSVFGSLAFDNVNKFIDLKADSQSSGQDLNNYTTEGFYFFSSGNIQTNVPSGVNGFLLVIKSSYNVVKQFWIRQGSENTQSDTWVRLLTSSGWTTWRKYAMSTEITDAINALNVASTSLEQGETLATIAEADGKIAVTKQDIKIDLGQVDNFYRCGSQNAISGSTTWHKIASTTITTINTDSVIMLAIYDAYIPYTATNSDTNCGILYCRVRQGNPIGTLNYAKLKFVSNSGFDASKFRLYCNTDSTGITFEIWTSMNRQYAWRKYSVISQSDRLSVYNNVWTLYNSTSPSAAPTESATCVRVECEDNTYKQTDNNILGAKNLIPYPPYYQASTYSRNNVDITVDEYGVITATGSKPSANFGYSLCNKSKNSIITLDPTQSYIMSGMSGGSSSTVRFLLDLWTASQNPETDSATRLYQATTETIIPSGYKYLAITLYFYGNANNLFPLTVKPMLRLATIADDTFEPYADTNRNLSIRKCNLTEIAPIENSNTASQAYAIGDYMWWYGGFYRVTQAIASGGTITLNTNVYPTSIGDQLRWKASSVSANEIQVKTTNTNIASGNASEIVIEEIRLYADSGVINNWFSCYRHIPLYNAVGYYKDCEFSWWDGNDSYYASISITKSGNYIIATCDAAKQGSRDITTYSDFKMYITVSEKS